MRPGFTQTDRALPQSSISLGRRSSSHATSALSTPLRSYWTEWPATPRRSVAHLMREWVWESCSHMTTVLTGRGRPVRVSHPFSARQSLVFGLL